jgi:hypothetical protein
MDFQVDYSGVSGERVNHSMRLRLENELQKAATQGIRWVNSIRNLNF